jgi:hypothetical protein
MEEDRELPCDRDERALPRILPSTAGDALAEAAQLTLGTKGSEDVLRRRDPEPAQERVARFGDPQLGIVSARLGAAGPESDLGTDGATRGKARGLLQGEHVAECGERAAAGALLETRRLGILRGGAPGEGGLGRADLGGALGSHPEPPLEGWLKRGGERPGRPAGQRPARAGGQALPGGLDRAADVAADVVDEQRAGAHEGIAGAHEGIAGADVGEIVLRGFAAVANRGQQRGLRPA